VCLLTGRALLAVFSRLESFLPAMAQENKRLEEAVAAGHGHEHNIEVEEAVEEEADADSSDEEEDAGASAAAQPAKKKRIIEMVCGTRPSLVLPTCVLMLV
jgi:hypothetical protein